jgi:hypothetical protein
MTVLAALVDTGCFDGIKSFEFSGDEPNLMVEIVPILKWRRKLAPLVARFCKTGDPTNDDHEEDAGSQLPPRYHFLYERTITEILAEN